MIDRIIENDIEIPINVTLSLEDKKVIVQGKNGQISRDFNHSKLKLEQKGDIIRIFTMSSRKKETSQVNTITNHIKNMIKGVTKGHKYKMKIVFVHFPMTVKIEDKILSIENFIGERLPRTAKIISGVKIEIKNDDIFLEGVDIEAVGQTAANIQQACHIRNKDLRKFLDGIYVYSKE